MIERRRHPRNPARQRALIVLPEHRAPIACTIRDTSPFGALIEYGRATALPALFHLLVGGTELLACRLVRADGNQAGVEFVRPAS